MAGMTYKGLTIRIGGDTTDLNRALKEVRSAASTMQGQLRRASAGLRFDPANVELLTAKMVQLSEKSVLAGAKASILRQHLMDLPSEALEAAKKNTGDLGARAALAYENYNRLNEQIAETRRSLAMEKYDLGADASEKEIEEAIAKYKEFEEECRQSGRVANEELDALQKHWKAYEQEVEAARDAVMASDMRIELEKLEAEAKQTAREFVDMKEKLRSVTGSAGLVEARSQVEFLGHAADDTKADIHQLDAALREGGRSASTAATKFLRLQQQESQLNERARALRTQLAELENQLSHPINPQSLHSANAEFQKAKGEFSRIKHEAELARGKVVALEDEMRQIGTPKTDEAVAALKRLENELVDAKADAQRLEMQLDKAEDEFNSAHTVREISKVQMELRQTEAQARGVSAAMSGMSAKNWYIIRSVGTVLMSTFTPMLMMGIQKITDASETLDSAWRDMRKTVNGTEDDFQHLKDAAIEFSKTHVTTADQILEIEAMGGQLGIVVEDLEAFATTVANLDIATNMESDQISEDLGKLANILGLSVDEYDNFGDSLVRLGNNEAALEGDIMKITTRYAGMGKIVGMSADQILAWATAATATGQKAEAAGSSMLRFVSNVETAVNGSEENLAKWAKVAGMSGQEFKKSFGEDASGTMYKFIEGLANIQKSGGSVNQTLMELGINNVRDKQLLEGLTQQMVNATDENNVLKDSLEMSANAWNGIADKWGQGSDAMVEAERKSEGFSGSMGKLRNTITALASSAGNSLVPWMDRLTTTIGGLEDAYSSLPEGTKQIINGLGAFVAAMGPVMMVVGAAGQGLTSFKKNMAENSAASMTAAQSLAVYDAQTRIDIMEGEKAILTKKKLALENMKLNASQKMMYASYTQEIDILDKNIKEQEKAIGKTKAMAGAMRAFKAVGVMAGISLAIAGISLLVEKLAEAKKHTDLLKKSHESMNRLFSEFDASEEEEELEKVTKSLKEVREATNEAMQANIDMADGFAKAMAELQGNYGNLDDVVERIQAISKSIDKSGEATKEQVNDLKTAVNQLNELAGTDWFVDDTGKILDKSKAMSELVGSYEALVDAYNQVHGTNLELDEEGNWDESVASLQDLVDAVNELNGTDFVIDENGSIVSASGEFNDLAVEIRDVITATDELKEAQDRLWARDVYKEWADEAGKNAMDQKAKLEEATKSYEEAEKKRREMREAFGSGPEGEARANANKEYQDQINLVNDFREDVDELTVSYTENSEAARMWNDTAFAFDAPSDSIEGVLTKYRDIGSELSDLEVGAGDMADVMKALGITFDDVSDLSADDVEKIADAWDGHMPSLIKGLQDAGVELDDTALKMADLAEKSGLTAPQISDMWAAFGGDVAKVQSAIEVLNDTDIDPKDVEFKDNSIIVNKHISDIDRKKIEDKGFTVDDGGTINTAIGEVNDLNTAIGSINSKSFSVDATGNAFAKVASLATTLTSIANATFTVKSKAGSATGAVVKNARGRALNGQVVSRPTMTNIGLVGEAGAEWVDDRSVIPLTNRKYMVPIAREIAAGLNTYSSGNNVNVSVSLNYSAGADANQMATDLTRALRRKILMEG
jgi:TP901 family phage tail tape measure protein